MPALNHSYTFKYLVGGNEEPDMRAYALCDGNINEVIPRNWSDDFESELEKYNGALIIISKDDTSDDFKRALVTYDNWCTNGTKVFHSLEDGIGFVYMENNLHKKAEPNIDNDSDNDNENDDTHKIDDDNQDNNNNDNKYIEMKIAKVKTIIKGNLLVITGSFPDITIPLSTNHEAHNAEMGYGYPLITISLLEGLLKLSLKFMLQLQNDISITSRGRRNTAYISPTLQEYYIYSREGYLYELSLVSLGVTVALNDILGSMAYYDRNPIINHKIKNIKETIEIYDKTLQGLRDKLGHMVDILETNITEFFGILRWIITIIVSSLLSIGIAAVYYSNQKENYTKRDLLMATCIIGGCGIVVALVVFKLFGRWYLRRRRFNMAKEA